MHIVYVCWITVIWFNFFLFLLNFCPKALYLIMQLFFLLLYRKNYFTLLLVLLKPLTMLVLDLHQLFPKFLVLLSHFLKHPNSFLLLIDTLALNLLHLPFKELFNFHFLVLQLLFLVLDLFEVQMLQLCNLLLVGLLRCHQGCLYLFFLLFQFLHLRVHFA